MSPQAGRHPARPSAVTDWRHRSRSPPRLAPLALRNPAIYGRRSPPERGRAAARRARILSAFSPPSPIGTPVSDGGGDRRSSSTACDPASTTARCRRPRSWLWKSLRPAGQTTRPGLGETRRGGTVLTARAPTPNAETFDTRHRARTIPAPAVTVSAVPSRSSSERRAPSGTTSSPRHMRSDQTPDMWR